VTDPTFQLIATIVPIIVSGIVAVVAAVVGADFRKQISDLTVRVAVLEQTLTDNHIPIPARPPASR